ncbi:hypothetical protein [Actinophytocola sp. NPDC049390]|uniref:hypothetical protein n=1 Tax=Actinophytocola sp. NPDC049390 TaxID=3363894 RepID=UPI003791A124
MSQQKTSAARRKAILTRHLGADHPDTQKAAQDWAYMALDEYVSAIVAKAPPLTEEQRAKIAALLAPVTETGAA